MSSFVILLFPCTKALHCEVDCVVYCFNFFIWPKIIIYDFAAPLLSFNAFIPLFPSLSWSFLLKLCAAMANSCVPSPEMQRTSVTKTGQYCTHYTPSLTPLS